MYYFDLDALRLLDDKRQPVTALSATRGGWCYMQVQLLRDGTAVTNGTLSVAAKPEGDYTGTPVMTSSVAGVAIPGSAQIVLPTCTDPMDSLLGVGTAEEKSHITLTMQITAAIGNWRYIAQDIRLTLRNNIDRPGVVPTGDLYPAAHELVTISTITPIVGDIVADMGYTPTPDATTAVAGKVKLAAAINATDTGAASGKQVFDHVKNNTPTIQDATATAKGIASFPTSGGLKVTNGAASVNVGEGLEIKDGKVCAIPVDLPPGVGEVITDTEGNIILETPYVDGTPKSTPGIKFVNKSTKPAGYENILRTDGDGRPEITGFGSIAFRNDIPDTSTFATKSELSGYATKSSAVFSGTRPKFNTVDLALLSEIPNISVKAPVDNPNFSGTIKLNSNPLVNIRYLYFTGTTWIESNTLMGSLDINSRYVVTLPYPARTVSVCAEIKARTSDVATGGGKWFRTGWATWVDSGGVSEACGVNADLYNGTAVVQTGLTRLTTTNSNYSGDPGNHTVKIDPANSCCRLVVIEIAEPTNRIS